MIEKKKKKKKKKDILKRVPITRISGITKIYSKAHNFLCVL